MSNIIFPVGIRRYNRKKLDIKFIISVKLREKNKTLKLKFFELTIEAYFQYVLKVASDVWMANLVSQKDGYIMEQIIV
jgi:hypothetical protein